MEDMEERGVDLSQVIKSKEDNTAFSVILKTEWGKDRSILAYKGANDLLTPEQVKPELFDDIKAFAWTSLTEDKACKAIDKAISLTRENEGMVLGAPSMSIIKNNPKWAKILIEKSDCVSLNREEALEFTNESDTINAIQHFAELGLDLISITNGSNGSFVSDGDIIVRSNVYDGEVEDTTGAGDAFLSGLLISCLRDIPLAKAAKIASSMALFESKEVGVREGIPTEFNTLEEFVEEHELRQNVSKFMQS
jgi:sugar/nucleoside kinase (ribokinase family)